MFCRSLYFLELRNRARAYMSKSIVLKISGKIVNPSNPQLIEKYSNIIRNLVDSGYRIAVVVGGGAPARDYISCARSLGLSEAQADVIGIEVSRINALLLAYALGNYAYTPIPRSIDDLEKAWNSGKVVVLGGLQPGQSTAGTAAVVAEILNIRRILYATDIDGVYDKDPKIYRDARKLDRVTVEKLEKVLRQRYEAGGYELLDPIALRIIKRSCIEVTIFNGMEPENIFKALKNEIGTLVVPC